MNPPSQSALLEKAREAVKAMDAAEPSTLQWSRLYDQAAPACIAAVRAQPEVKDAGGVVGFPKVVVHLPDGDSRQAMVRWTEWKGDELHVCISIQSAAPSEGEDGRRLDWLTENGLRLARLDFGWRLLNYAGVGLGNGYKTPREAIDAAMQDDAALKPGQGGEG